MAGITSLVAERVRFVREHGAMTDLTAGYVARNHINSKLRYN